MREILKLITTLSSLIFLLSVSQCEQLQRFQREEEPKTYYDHADDEKNEALEAEVAELTDQFRNLPSSTDINRHIEEQLTPTYDPCTLQHCNESTNDSLAAMGARRMLATYYQSCQALESVISPTTPPLEGITSGTRISGRRNPRGGKLRQITNTAELVRSHYLLGPLSNDDEYPKAPLCRDMTETPPVYGYGSRLSHNRSENSINLFTSGDGVITPPAAVASDCSTFISSALATAGLRIRKGGPAFRDLTTDNFNTYARRADSCIKHAEFEGEASLVPGDMVNVARNHIIMIDTVGPDPLGIKKHADARTCSSLRVSDFNFTYIHSGAIKNSYGPSRVHISAHRGGTMFNNLMLNAQAMCRRLVAGDQGRVSSRQLNANGSFGILRHQSHDPACKMSTRVKLVGEECTDECFN